MMISPSVLNKKLIHPQPCVDDSERSSLGLPNPCNSGYRVSMDDTVWMMLVGVGGVVLWLLTFQHYRRWKAGKLAHQLLQDVIKGKDAFRR